MRLNLTADSIKVDDDEGRIILIIDTDEGDTVTVNIHAVALEFYANVQAELRPYALEAEHARQAVAAGMPLDEYLGGPRLVTNRPIGIEDALAAGYDLLDPKSPGFHDRMVD